MSAGGGGRPGRGRGRGRPSRNMHILQETGIGGSMDGTMLLHHITHPPLYPDLLWHSSGCRRSSSRSNETSISADLGKDVVVKTEANISVGPNGQQQATPSLAVKRSAIVTYILGKQEEILTTLQEQQQQLSHAATAPQAKRQKVLSNALGYKMAQDLRYFPSDLLFATLAINQKRKVQTRAIGSFDELQDEDEAALPVDVVSSSDAARDDPEDEKEGDEEDGDVEEEVELEEVEEEELDYTQDYYASEGESDGDGGDGEAVF